MSTHLAGNFKHIVADIVVKCYQSSHTETPLSKKRKADSVWSCIPEMEDVESLKEKVYQLKKICRLPRTDQALVKTLMSSTFPLRRKSVIEGTENLVELLKSYPPL